MDLDGREVWRQIIDKPAGLSLTAMELIGDDHLVLVGTAERPETSGDLLKPRRGGWIGLADLSGKILSGASVAGDSDLRLNDIVGLPGGGFAAVGSLRSTGTEDTDGFVVTTDEALRETSKNRFGGETNEALNGVAALPNGMLIAVGVRSVDGLTDGWVVALEPHENGVDDTVDRAKSAVPQPE